MSQCKSKRCFDLILTLLSAATPVALLAYHVAKNNRKTGTGRHRPKAKKWFSGTFTTPFSTALTLDLTFTYLVFLRFAKREVASGRVKGPFWLYAALATCVGVSPAFPLLLLMRKPD